MRGSPRKWGRYTRHARGRNPGDAARRGRRETALRCICPPVSAPWFRISGIGLVVWGAFVATGRLWPSGDDPVSHAIAFAILVVVPLALAVAPEIDGERAYRQTLAFLLPLGQLGALVAIATDARLASVAGASAWVVASVLVALMGVGRLRSRDGVLASRVGLGLAWMLLPVGAVWLTMARAGIAPLGLSTLLVSLTAAHFHVAGLATLTLLAVARRSAQKRWAQRSLDAGIGLATLAIALVALGITLAPQAAEGHAVEASAGVWISRIGALTYVVVLSIHAAAVALDAATPLRPLPRALVTLGALAPLAAMALAVAYTFGAIDLDTMIAWHGPLNAYGFAGLTLTGWALGDRGARAR